MTSALAFLVASLAFNRASTRFWRPGQAREVTALLAALSCGTFSLACCLAGILVLLEVSE